MIPITSFRFQSWASNSHPSDSHHDPQIPITSLRFSSRPSDSHHEPQIPSRPSDSHHVPQILITSLRFLSPAHDSLPGPCLDSHHELGASITGLGLPSRTYNESHIVSRIRFSSWAHKVPSCTSSSIADLMSHYNIAFLITTVDSFVSPLSCTVIMLLLYLLTDPSQGEILHNTSLAPNFSRSFPNQIRHYQLL